MLGLFPLMLHVYESRCMTHAFHQRGLQCTYKFFNGDAAMYINSGSVYDINNSIPHTSMASGGQLSIVLSGSCT